MKQKMFKATRFIPKIDKYKYNSYSHQHIFYKIFFPSFLLSFWSCTLSFHYSASFAKEEEGKKFLGNREKAPNQHVKGTLVQ